jgi:NitT/TauT family transport system substrate-binding protein
MNRLRNFVVVIFALVLAIGCDNTDNTSSSGPTTATAGGGGSPAEVRIGYFANLTHAQGVLGVASGDYAKAVAPAKVSMKVFNAGPSLVEALFAGEIDVGYVGPGPALNAHAKSRGRGIRIVAGAAANGVLIVAQQDSGIVTLSDLAGKRVATPQMANTQDIAARYYLTKQLGQKDHKNVMAVPNAEQAAMMVNKQIDAAWAPEPWASLLVAQAGAKVVAQEKDLWPQKSFSITVVITTPEFLQKHPATVEKLIGAHQVWTARLNQEPDKYVPQLKSALFDLTNKKLPEGVVESALKNTVFTDEPLPHTFETMANWAYELGPNFARERTDVKGLIDTTILKKLQASQGGAAQKPAGTKEGA